MANRRRIKAASSAAGVETPRVRRHNHAPFAGLAPRVIEEKDLANSSQARKRARQSEKRRAQNAGIRSATRTEVKKVVKAISAGDKATAESAYKATVPLLDRVANKNLMGKNNAARKKSRLNARIKAMS